MKICLPKINRERETGNRKLKTGDNGLLFRVYSLKFKKGFSLKRELISSKPGFSLIELLIVISLFALVSVIVTVSYIGYGTREEVKNAALSLKADLRLAQNQAKSGDKGLTGSNCASTSTLAGWYVNVDNSTTAKAAEYIVGGVCLTGSSESPSESPIGTSKTVTLPTGVAISSIKYNNIEVSSGIVNIFFRPIEYIVTFHGTAGTPAAPNFFDDGTGALSNYLGAATDRYDLVITLAATDGGSYEVKVTSYGDIEEKKI